MKKRFEECPYLWKVSNGENLVIFAYANTPSEALKLAEKELTKTEPITVDLVCFANDIINFK